MKSRWNSQTWLSFSAVLALALCSVAAGQTSVIGRDDSAQTPTSVTLLMAWERGDPHYGASFILLHTHCQNSEDDACECEIPFKAIDSQEFADYISSFGGGKVPVVYSVVYSRDGTPGATRLVSVGAWAVDRFPINDRFIGARFRFRGSTSNKHQIHGSAACFPKSDSVRLSALNQEPSEEAKPSLTPHNVEPQKEQWQTPEPIHIPQDEARGMLITKVQPNYPQDARDKHIQGMVVLKAQINEDGNVTGVTLISGHPMLVPAAMEAVRQWTYRPYRLKGQPVAVETNVTVDFRLSQE